MFVKVKLKVKTKTGTHFVANATVPDFKPMPDVIIWGSRVFIFDPECPFEYNEAFAYMVPPGMHDFDQK